MISLRTKASIRAATSCRSAGTERSMSSLSDGPRRRGSGKLEDVSAKLGEVGIARVARDATLPVAVKLEEDDAQLEQGQHAPWPEAGDVASGKAGIGLDHL